MVNAARRFVSGALLGAGLFALATLSAAEAAGPTLTVEGKINGSSAMGELQLQRSELEALGTVVVETRTPWHDGPTTFEGVSLYKLMDHVGAAGETVKAIALNDYSSVIPLSDVVEHGPILAFKTNGEYMSVRNKGPYFVIYPYDSSPDLQAQKYYARSVWQVTRLVVD
jgi:hypothetical protein